MADLVPYLVPTLLVVAALLVAADRRGLLLAAAVPAAFGGAMVLRLGGVPSELVVTPPPREALGAGFALLLAGAGLAAAALPWREAATARGVQGAAAAVAAAVAAPLPAALRLGLAPIAGLAAIVAGGLALAWLAGSRLGLDRPVRVADRWLAPEAPASAQPGRGSMALPLLLLGGAAVMVGPSALLILAGALAASVAAALLRPGHAALVRWGQPALLGLVLAPLTWLLATVAGPVGLGVATLGDVPLSPAAQTLAGLLLLGAAWVVSGLFPLHGLGAPAWGVALAGALVGRVGAAAMPEGIAHWAPLAFALGAAAAWWAAARARPDEVLGAGAVLAAVAGAEASPPVQAPFVGLYALLLAVVAGPSLRASGGAATRAAVGVFVVAATPLAVRELAVMLGAEVTWSLAWAGALAAALAGARAAR